ncbi:MAG: AEC family transporter [Pseudomonadota bacterium]
MSGTIAVTLPFFALIACGLAAARWGVAGTSTAPALNAFVLWFALPALLIRKLGSLPLADMLDVGFLAGWAAASFAVFVATALVARALGSPAKAAVIQAATAAHGNVGYLGITLVIGVAGAAATAPVAMAIIVDFMLVVPAVIAAIEFTAQTGRTPISAFARAIGAAITSPFLLSLFIGLGLSASGLALPTVVDDFLVVLGGAAVPTALFSIGVTLYGQPLRGSLGELSVLTVIKLAIHPVLVLLVMGYWLELDAALVQAGVLLAALPVANNVFLLATRYEVRPGLVSGAILVSTAVALVSFNLLAAYLAG